jgi:hypothetical protein
LQQPLLILFEYRIDALKACSSNISSEMTIDTTMSIPETQGDGIRKIMLDILNQLREEMDLSRVSLPAFLLEPISMLERITHFSAHLELLLRHNFKIMYIYWWLIV